MLITEHKPSSIDIVNDMFDYLSEIYDAATLEQRRIILHAAVDDICDSIHRAIERFTE